MKQMKQHVLFGVLSFWLTIPVYSQWAFEEEIMNFEKMDLSSPPGNEIVLFTGSSSIRMWKSLSEDFSKQNVINRGFGGSQFTDLLYYYDRVIYPYSPRKILIYEGDNDIANGKNADQVLSDFQLLADKMRLDFPDCKIAFISIKPSPSRWHLKDEMIKANQLIEQYCESNDITFIDIFSPMIYNGRPIPDLYISDSLHMTEKGYEIWVEETISFVTR